MKNTTIGSLMVQLSGNPSEQQIEEIKKQAEKIVAIFTHWTICLGCRYERDCIVNPGCLDCVDMAEMKDSCAI